MNEAKKETLAHVATIRTSLLALRRRGQGLNALYSANPGSQRDIDVSVTAMQEILNIEIIQKLRLLESFIQRSQDDFRTVVSL